MKFSQCNVTSKASLEEYLPPGSFTLRLLFWEKPPVTPRGQSSSPGRSSQGEKPKIAANTSEYQLTVTWMNPSAVGGSFSPHQAFRWLQSWPTSWWDDLISPEILSHSAKLLLSPWPKETVMITNCWFLTLSFRVIYYAATASKYNPFWSEHWGYIAISRGLLKQLFFFFFASFLLIDSNHNSQKMVPVIED